MISSIMTDENSQQSDKKDSKSQFKIAETVTADGPKRPKPTDSDSDSN